MTLQHENICFDSGENSCKLIGCYCQELQMMCGLDGWRDTRILALQN